MFFFYKSAELDHRKHADRTAVAVAVARAVQAFGPGLDKMLYVNSVFYI